MMTSKLDQSEKYCQLGSGKRQVLPYLKYSTATSVARLSTHFYYKVHCMKRQNYVLGNVLRTVFRLGVSINNVVGLNIS
jgi:hypothetical protein